MTPLASFKHSLFLEYRTPINTPEADFLSFLLKGKRIKTFEACKEIPATLHCARPRSNLMLHAPFSLCRTGQTLRENAITHHLPLFLHRLHLLFCEKNRFNFSLKTNLSIKELRCSFYEVLGFQWIILNNYRQSPQNMTTCKADVFLSWIKL